MSGICLSTRAFGAQNVKNDQLAFPASEPRDKLWGERRSRTHPLLIARENCDVMQFISASFCASPCQLFAWTRRCSSMFVTSGQSNPLLASSLCPHCLRCSHKIPGHVFREKAVGQRARATPIEELFHDSYHFTSPRIRVIIWSFVSFTFHPLHLIPSLTNSAILWAPRMSSFTMCVLTSTSSRLKDSMRLLHSSL